MEPMFIGVGAAAGIAWVNWYFLFSQRSAVAAAPSGAAEQEVRITVDGGYSPAVAKVAKGVPVRLVFDRKEKSPCSEEVVIERAGIRTFLPPFSETVVEFTPVEGGVYEFACGMNMLRGRLEVEG